MTNTDTYAYASRLRSIEPMQKFIFALLTLAICLWANHVIVSVLVIIIMGGCAVWYGGTPLSFYLKLLLIPLAFLLIGTLTIVINISSDSSIFIWSIPIGNTWLGVTQVGLYKGVKLFLRVLGSVACLYFLSLTTPMVDILSFLQRLKLPQLLVEMMSLIYRFIFVLLDTANTIVIAQDSRLGYRNLATGFRSLGSMAANLFIRAYKRSNAIYISLEARGYDGELQVVKESYKSSRCLSVATIGVNLFLIILTLILNRRI